MYNEMYLMTGLYKQGSGYPVRFVLTCNPVPRGWHKTSHRNWWLGVFLGEPIIGMIYAGGYLNPFVHSFYYA